MNQTIAALDQRAEDMWTHILAGRASSADIAEYERTTTALQDALCDATVRASPLREVACACCGKTFTTAILNGDICLPCLLDDADDWPVEDTDAIVGPVRIDTAALEAWEHSRANDYDVTDEIPY